MDIAVEATADLPAVFGPAPPATPATAPPRAASSAQPDVLPRRRADSPEAVPGVSPARRDRTDGVRDLRTDASVRPGDPHGGHRSEDAALVRRSSRRPLCQRSVAQRSGNRHTRRVGRQRGSGRRSGPRTESGELRQRLADRNARRGLRDAEGIPRPCERNDRVPKRS